jgi:hypothetical protein
MRPVVNMSSTAARPIRVPPATAEIGVKVVIVFGSRGNPERCADGDSPPDHHVDERPEDLTVVTVGRYACEVVSDASGKGEKAKSLLRATGINTCDPVGRTKAH